MNEQINAYLDAVCAQIRCREVHAAIRLELESHIADRVDALVAGGRSETEAVALALRQMGDPVAVGLGLHKVHRPRTDWQLLATVAGLLLVGFWAMYAASVSESYGPFPLLAKQLLWTALGGAAAAGLYFFDYRRLQPHGWWLMGLAALAVAATTTAGKGTPAASVGSPLLFVPGLAALFSRWDWSSRGSGWLAALLGVVPPIVYVQVNQIRFVLLYIALWGALLLLSRPRLSRLLPLIAGGVAAIGLCLQYVFAESYRVNRLRIWLMPWDDPQGMGYMAIQARRMLTEAGLWGHGALNRELLLPEVHTTSVFPYLVHTLGWVAGAAICLLILLFLVRLARASALSRNRFGFFLVVGFLVVLGLSFIWNITMAAGWTPTTGMDLPFISYGRQQVVQMAAVGLILSVFRRKDLNQVTQ